jgi:hypothetical protein
VSAWRARLIRWLAGDQLVILNAHIEGGRIAWTPGRIEIFGNHFTDIGLVRLAGESWLTGMKYEPRD